MDYKLFLDLLCTCYPEGDAEVKSKILSVIGLLNRKGNIFKNNKKSYLTYKNITVSENYTNCYTVGFYAGGFASHTFYIKRQNGKKQLVFEL